MYLDSKDFQTVWQLAHNWVDANPGETDTSALPAELKESIHRLMHAGLNQAISLRTRKRGFFFEESLLASIVDFGHFRKFIKCIRQDEFDKAYLDSIYVKRSDILRWCQNEFLSPPPIWKADQVTDSNSIDDDENAQWHRKLTDRQRKVITCLEIAKRIWQENPSSFYEDIYSHPDLIKQDKPRIFTLDSFKKWTREFAPEAAKAAGRRKESKQ